MAFASGLPDITDLLLQIGTITNAMGGEGGMISKAAVLVGGFFLCQAAYRAYQAASPHGGGQHGGMERIAVPVFFGTLLINFWATQQGVSDQLALQGGVLSPALPSAYLQQMWAALKTVLHGFGTVMVFRGLLLAKSIGDGQHGGHNNPAWGAFWHVVGGALLMNT